jgi:SHS2 domain-containing protein
MTGDEAFRFIDDVTSDLTFEARGATLGDVFAAASEALLAAAVERPEAVRDVVERRLALEDSRLDWLLRRFLSELVYLLDAEHLALRARRVDVRGEAPDLRLDAVLVGETLDRGRHVAANDVKAVTAYGLEVARDEHGGWRARVTLDV